MERCKRCLRGRLQFRWFSGKLRHVCSNRECRAVFGADDEFLGVLPASDAMYEGAETA